MNKGKITVYLRNMGLMMLTDRFKYFLYKLLNLNKNKKFLKENPEINLPSDYIIFESF